MDALVDSAIEIRRRGPGDDAFIERLGREAFAVFDPKAGPSTRRLGERPDAEALIAVRGRERLGFLVLVTRGSTSWIEAIAVLERQRGLGVGMRLMQAAVRAARRHGVRRLSLTTAQANVEALELFLRCDFRIERRMPRFYAAGQDACVLSRSL